MFAIAKKLIAELQSVSERLESLRNGIKEHTEAIHAKYDKAEDDRKKEGDRQYTVQNSLRWATWCAVGAAVIYAGVSAWQTGEISHNFRMDQRAWMKITPDSTPNVNTNPALWIARYSDVGKTPARKVAAEFQFQFLKKGEFPIFDYKKVPSLRLTSH